MLSIYNKSKLRKLLKTKKDILANKNYLQFNGKNVETINSNLKRQVRNRDLAISGSHGQIIGRSRIHGNGF